MKTTQTKWQWRLAVLMTAFTVATVRADNPCIENITTNQQACVSQGTLVTNYVLAPTNITAGVGQIITQPTVSNLSMTNGLETNYVTYICTPSSSGWQTSSIPYTFGSLYFIPSLPQAIWTPGTNTYTAYVIATGSPCNPVTNTLGAVTVTVSSNNPDVLLNVDFGGRTNSAKTGYAVIGDSNFDFWNAYGLTNQTSGLLASLKTAEGYVSPVGLLVTNLPTAGTNGSTDAMYYDFLHANSGVATLTLTNLPSGTWNVYLYADGGNFDLKVGANDYGTQTCYDGSPISTPLAWQQGVQYVAFQNVTVTNGQPVTVTVSPGTNGTAMISGLQIASVNHSSQQPVLSPTNMVSWWKAENNALDSIGTNNGTLVGGVSYASGEVGQSFYLNGSSAYVTVPDSPTLNFSNAMTVECWLYRQSVVGSYDPVVKKAGTVANGNSGYSLEFNGNNISLWIYNGGWNSSASGSIALGQWYHVAGVYDGTNLLCYINGQLVGSAVTTSGSILPPSNPLNIGGDGGSRFFNGLIDEVSVYNRALSSNEIAAIYNAGSSGKIASLTQDSDYDGVSDLQELADRTNPNDFNSVLHIRLGYWPFDITNTWVGSAGQLPLLATNVVGVPSWDTNAVLIDTNTVAILKYRDVETNGNANINIRSGTIRFWFKPDWSSVSAGGIGPQDQGRLIEMGQQGTTTGWWTLMLDTNGNNVTFVTQTNGVSMTNLTTAVSWSSNLWHQVVLTYGVSNSLLYIDGQAVVTNGLSSQFWPNATERSAGFCIGSDAPGTNQARGVFDELDTFNYPLDAGSIQTNYQAAWNLDSNGDGLSNILENELGINPYGINSSYGLSLTNGLQVFTPLK